MRFTLLNAIRRSGRTQREIARARDIRESRLSEIVRGWATPTADERAAIAAELSRPERGLFRNTQTETTAVVDGPDDAAA